MEYVADFSEIRNLTALLKIWFVLPIPCYYCAEETDYGY